MARGRPRKNPAQENDVLIRSAELIGWALGGIEREIMETRNRLASLTAQANALRARIGRKSSSQRPLEVSTAAAGPSEQEAQAPSPLPGRSTSRPSHRGASGAAAGCPPKRASVFPT